MYWKNIRMECTNYSYIVQPIRGWIIKLTREITELTIDARQCITPIFLTLHFCAHLLGPARRNIACAKVEHKRFYLSLCDTCRCFCRGSLVHALTHWGRVTHICVVILTIIGSDNGLSPVRRQAIIWTNAGMLLIGPSGTNFREILIGIQTFSFNKMHLKMSSAKWRPFCLGFNVLMLCKVTTTFSGHCPNRENIHIYPIGTCTCQGHWNWGKPVKTSRNLEAREIAFHHFFETLYTARQL